MSNNLYKNLILSSEEYKDYFDFWMQNLEGDLKNIQLPLNYKEKSLKSFATNKIAFKLSEEIEEKIMALCKNSDLNIYITLLSAYNCFLYKYTGNHDLIIGSPLINSSEDDLNTIVPIRTKLDNTMTFKDVLINTKKTTLDAYKNQNYPIDMILEELSDDNGAFDFKSVVFSYGKIHDLNKMNNIQYDLMIVWNSLDNSLQAEILFNSEVLSVDIIQKIVDLYIKTIECFIKNINERIGLLDEYFESERKICINSFNDNKYEIAADKTIHMLFDEQADKTPNNVAVAYEEDFYTYKELKSKTNQLARLLRSKGVTANSIVAIMLNRSLNMICSILGVIKSGAAYMPIDPDYPKERIEYMLKDSGAKLLVTHEKLIGLADFNGEIINIDDKTVWENDDSSIECITKPDDLVYVIYTSGSTGNPKGVMIENKSLVNLVYGLKQNIYDRYKDYLNISMLSPYVFDASVKQIFPALLLGHALYVIPDRVRFSKEELISYCMKHHIDILDGTPTHLKMLFKSDEDTNRNLSIKHFIIGGEELTVEFARELLGRFDNSKPLITNVYGPTECCDVSTTYTIEYKMLDEITNIPIGKPIKNARIYILNEYGNISQIGMPGELCIAGMGLARGYLNRAELTAEKFVDNPYKQYNEAGTSAKMYRTGDLARWLPDGNIEFLGRLDYQVKIRGYRIELGEIESKLLRHETINEAVVIAREDKNGEKYLCAYIVGDSEIKIPELREFLSKDLPDYMIPSYFVQLDKLPLTPNGKLDRKSLPEPNGNMTKRAEYEAPRNETEEKLVEIWKEVLKVDKIGINDNFFELGGHSLKAASLAAKLQKEFAVDIPLSKIFKAPTIKEFAEVIYEAKTEHCEAIKPTEKREFYPVSSSQKRIFILNQINSKSTSYNMHSVKLIEGSIDIEKFQNTFKALVKRHESLRTSFDYVEGEIVQFVHDDIDFNIDYYETDKDINEILIESKKPFDLTKAPLLRVDLVKIDKSKYLFITDIHHIISDGVSINILLNDFVNLYNNKKLPELKIQYRDYAAWQNEMYKIGVIKKQEQYWLSKLNDFKYTELPKSSNSMSDKANGASIDIIMDKSIVMRINDYCIRNRITKFTFMLTIFKIAIFNEIKQEDISIGVPIAGRKYNGLENLIGIFLNAQVIRTLVEKDMAFKEYLRVVEKAVIEAQDNQDYPFEELYSKMKDEKGYAGNSLFSILFNYMPQRELPETEFGDISIKPLRSNDIDVKYQVTLYIKELINEISLTMVYDSTFYAKESMERILKDLISIAEIVLNDENTLIKDIILSIKDIFEDAAAALDGDISVTDFENDDFYN